MRYSLKKIAVAAGLLGVAAAATKGAKHVMKGNGCCEDRDCCSGGRCCKKGNCCEDEG